MSSAPRRYRCMRSGFTLREYVKYRETAFWPLPTIWGDPNHPPMLAMLKREGGTGLLSVLPWLGRIAASPDYQPWAIAAEELARLCGVDPKSVRRARDVLQRMKLASTETRLRNGARLLHWTVRSELAARAFRRGEKGVRYGSLPAYGMQGDEGFRDGYFYFSFAMLYGGHWSALDPVQRAVYLAAATKARVHRDEPNDDWVTRDLLVAGVSLADLEAGWRWGRQEYRLACVSYSELARISGYGVSALKNAVQGLKHPSIWPDSSVDAAALHHAPLWVYPTRGGRALVYHFRDHADPWPSAVENKPVPPRPSVGPTPDQGGQSDPVRRPQGTALSPGEAMKLLGLDDDDDEPLPF